MNKASDPLVQPRIEVVDALRGFALLGLCLIHALEHFDLLMYPETAPAVLRTLDPLVHGVVFFLFAGKAFAIFSFMFGLSFFIQMDRQARRGVDFRGRFLWRLILLGILGYLHGLLYCGDVLILFAVLGMLLVPLDRLGSRTLLALSVLMVANLPYLYLLWRVVGDPSFDPRPYGVWNLYGEAFQIFSQGSLDDVVRFNAWQGQKMKWLWYLQEGRIWQILGLFLWGMVAGRTRIFETLGQKKNRCWQVLLVSLVGFMGFYAAGRAIAGIGLHDNVDHDVEKLLTSYANLLLMIVLMSAFVLLYERRGWQRKLGSLAPLGRMSLSNYVVQSLVGVPFFYGFGLAMYQRLGQTLSLLFGAVLIALMIWASRAWLRRFHYGPLEWIWRVGTFRSLGIPFARSRQG